MIIRRLFYCLSISKIMLKLTCFLTLFTCTAVTGYQAFNTLNAYQEAHLNRLNTYLEAVNK